MKTEINDYLIQLQKKHGTLTPEIVVSDARRKDSPLHGCFVWDVKKAAHEHWLDTARQLIRSVRVVIVQDNKVLKAPYFVRDPRMGSKEQGYAATAELRGDADLAREVVADECARAASAFRRAQEVANALGVESDVLDLISRTVALKDRVLEAEAAA